MWEGDAQPLEHTSLLLLRVMKYARGVLIFYRVNYLCFIVVEALSLSLSHTNELWVLFTQDDCLIKNQWGMLRGLGAGGGRGMI